MPEAATAPDQADWQKWFQGVAQYGLQAKWDAEYRQPFTVNDQVPNDKPAKVAPNGIPMPYVIAGAAVAVVGVGVLVWALSD